MKKYQGGFTLIELVMVIVILGVLAAFALPRFADLGGDARAASIQAAGGAMKSAANIAHAKFLASGLETTPPNTILLEGVSIPMANGYPTVDGILVAAQITGGPDGDYDVAPAGTTPMTVTAKGAATAATCRVTYTAATATAAPVIDIDVDGC